MCMAQVLMTMFQQRVPVSTYGLVWRRWTKPNVRMPVSTACVAIDQTPRINIKSYAVTPRMQANNNDYFPLQLVILCICCDKLRQISKVTVNAASHLEKMQSQQRLKSS